MKKSILSLAFVLIILILPKFSFATGVVFEIAGHFKCNQVSPYYLICTCEPPLDKRCLAFIMNGDGTITIEFGYEDPGDTTPYTTNSTDDVESYFQSSSGQISIELSK
jgi:hypothetical protein